MSKLKYAVNDARAFFEFLTVDQRIPVENVSLLLNEQASLQNLRSILGTRLKAAAAPEDLVIIYFAGHGATERDSTSPDGDGLEKYLLGFDSDPADLFSTALPMRDVGLILSRVRSETGGSIKHALFEWLRQALSEDVVVIYFSGHGSPESPESRENFFLLPYDADYENVASTGFPMWDIETALKRFIKAKKVIVVADACHSGGVGKSFDIARKSEKAVVVNPVSTGLQGLSTVSDGVCIISALDDSQFSQEGGQWGGGHGVFTHYLLQGLKGEADYNRDGVVNLGEIIPYLSENVRRATKNLQTPTVAGKFDPALSIGK